MANVIKRFFHFKLVRNKFFLTEIVFRLETSRSESPNQVLFKEKLRELQKEFPEKLSSNDILFTQLFLLIFTRTFQCTLRMKLTYF